jgi:hypothetical protein
LMTASLLHLKDSRLAQKLIVSTISAHQNAKNIVMRPHKSVTHREASSQRPVTKPLVQKPARPALVTHLHQTENPIVRIKRNHLAGRVVALLIDKENSNARFKRDD